MIVKAQQLAKIVTNLNFPIVTCLLKLCKATCSATHCGRSDTSASASQHWSTKVYVNKPTTIQALKEEIRRCISEIQPQLCQTVIENFIKRTQVSQQSRGGYLPDEFPINNSMSTL